MSKNLFNRISTSLILLASVLLLAPALDPADPSTVFYTPTPAEINAGQAIVTLRGYPVNGCGNFVDDSRTLNIDNLPSVNLNNSADLCEDDASYRAKVTRIN